MFQLCVSRRLGNKAKSKKKKKAHTLFLGNTSRYKNTQMMFNPLDTPVVWAAVTLVFVGSLAILSVYSVLYLHKRFRQAKEKAAEDRRNFIYLFVPVLVFSALALWLLFFRNPFKTGSVKQTAFFANSILGPDRALEGRLFGLPGGESGLARKFLWGFIFGMTSIIAFRNRYTTNNFIKAIVL